MIVVVLAACLLLSVDGHSFAAGKPSLGPLRITTRTGVHVFRVEEAVNERQREVGLMHRSAMPADHGMLFVFPATRSVTFWMKDTLIPLDMLFIRADGRIAGIVANAEPLSETMIPSPSPVRFVLELNGGMAARIGAATGDRIEHRRIGGSAR